VRPSEIFYKWKEVGSTYRSATNHQKATVTNNPRYKKQLLRHSQPHGRAVRSAAAEKKKTRPEIAGPFLLTRTRTS
jgi:hypothetical protein